jgi:hypothetical protein
MVNPKRRSHLNTLIAFAAASLVSSAFADQAASAAQAKGSEGVERALKELIAAYENADANGVEAHLDPTMIGFGVLMQKVHDSIAAQKQIRIALKDLQTTVGPDAALVRVSWEKRFLALPAMTAVLRSGSCILVFQRDGANWRLAGITGDNLFAAGSQ